MPPAANPCELTWIKKAGKVLKERETLDFQNPGFSGLKKPKILKYFA
jgi:hypothetical protein